MSTVSRVKKPVIALVTILVIVIAAAGVYFATQTTSPSTTAMMTTSGAATRDTLSIDETSWPVCDLNQLYAPEGCPYSDWLMYTVYQSLVTTNASAMYQGPGTVQVLPMLATSWSVSSDEATYTFNLRQNVTFSNGDPFNAYQVWGAPYGFYYLTGNSSSFFSGYNVFDMSKANFGPATIALMTQSGLVSPTPALLSIMSNSSWPIYVTGPYQIVFHLKAPFIWFPETLASGIGLIFDTQYVLQNGGFGTPAALNTAFNQKPIPGTGPYVVTEVSESAYAKFTQNPTYWGKSLMPADIQANPYLDPGHAKNVIIRAVTDDVARYTDLSTGAVQIAGIQTQNWPLILANPDKYGYFVMPDASMVIVGIAMNAHRYPTNITDFRQAIVHAVNYTDVSRRAFFNGLTPMMGPEYPAQKEFYDLGNLPPYQYNLTLAQQYLTASGVNVTTTPIDFRILAGCTFCISTAQIVQADLSQIGITVNIEVIPSSEFGPPYIAATSYSASLANAQQISNLSMLGVGTFAPGAATPTDAWILFVNQNAPVGNYGIYSNPIVQKCVDAWTSTNDVNQIKQLCTAAQLQIYNDAPYLWLGSVKLVFGSGSVAWLKSVVSGGYLDSIYTGMSETFVFNTVTFVSS